MDQCLVNAILGMASPLTIRRKPSGVYDEYGRWVERDWIEFVINAVVQRMNSHDLIRVPEGRRTSGSIKVYTLDRLYTASVETQTQSDRVVWHDDIYEVEAIDDWSEFGFYRAVALEVGQ